MYRPFPSAYPIQRDTGQKQLYFTDMFLSVNTQFSSFFFLNLQKCFCFELNAYNCNFKKTGSYMVMQVIRNNLNIHKGSTKNIIEQS